MDTTIRLSFPFAITSTNVTSDCPAILQTNDTLHGELPDGDSFFGPKKTVWAWQLSMDTTIRLSFPFAITSTNVTSDCPAILQTNDTLHGELPDGDSLFGPKKTVWAWQLSMDPTIGLSSPFAIKSTTLGLRSFKTNDTSRAKSYTHTMYHNVEGIKVLWSTQPNQLGFSSGTCYSM